jgi:hypothetical protein
MTKATDWRNRELPDWTVGTFRAYLIERHQEILKVPYYPFRSWQVDQKMLRTCLQEHGPEITKAFIDEALETYKPTSDYPGTSFGFIFSYKNNILQKKIKEANRDKPKTDRIELDWI